MRCRTSAARRRSSWRVAARTAVREMGCVEVMAAASCERARGANGFDTGRIQGVRSGHGPLRLLARRPGPDAVRRLADVGAGALARRAARSVDGGAAPALAAVAER